MQASYSRIDTFKRCPYNFKLRYIDELRTKFNLDPTNALVLGTALHTGIEDNVLKAILGYYSNYPSVTALMINEAIKLEVMIDKARKVLPRGIYEMKLETEEFKGFIDLLNYLYTDENGIEYYDLYDFKYSNNVDNYMKSKQLHVYKYYFEKLNPSKKIRTMSFVFVPKVNLKREEEEDISIYRNRLIAECEKQEVNIVPIQYDHNKVIEFLNDCKECESCKEFNKNPSKLCYWCDYRKYCQSNGKEDGNIIYPDKKKEESEE